MFVWFENNNNLKSHFWTSKNATWIEKPQSKVLQYTKYYWSKFLNLIFLVSSLECNACRSSTSWDDCKVSQEKCLPQQNQCIKVYFKYGGSEIFSKGCAHELSCGSSENPICGEAAGSDFTCDITCCNDKDNCNAGSALSFSSFLFLACASASLMFYVKFWHYSSVACSGFGNICFQMIGLSKFKKEKKNVLCCITITYDW